MSKIIIITGLPGSGKTTYIKDNFNSDEILICDDYYRDSEGFFEKSKYHSLLIDALKSNKEIVISDIIFCKSQRLKKFILLLEELSNSLNAKIDLDFIFFENNPRACKKNILYRKREKRVEKELLFLEEFSPGYKISEKAEIIPVFER